jgi:hypothetical protein
VDSSPGSEITHPPYSQEGEVSRREDLLRDHPL